LDGLTGRKAAATSERTRGVAPVLARRRGEETAEKAGHRRRAPGDQQLIKRRSSEWLRLEGGKRPDEAAGSVQVHPSNPCTAVKVRDRLGQAVRCPRRKETKLRSALSC